MRKEITGSVLLNLQSELDSSDDPEYFYVCSPQTSRTKRLSFFEKCILMQAYY